MHYTPHRMTLQYTKSIINNFNKSIKQANKTLKMTAHSPCLLRIKWSAPFQKKDEVLKKISIQEQDFIYCLENIKEIFEIYQKDEKSEQRKILLIRDLLATNRFLGDNQKNKLKIISYGAYLASNPANIKEFFALNREKNKRYKLRQSFIG